MKRGFTKGTLSSIVKKVAITTLALAAIFTLNVTAVSASTEGRTGTERESRILLPSGIRSDADEGRTGTERESRILLPSGIRSDADEGRTGTERESRTLLPSGIRDGLDALFSWVGGNSWWLWAPIAAVAAVGAWFFMA